MYPDPPSGPPQAQHETPVERWSLLFLSPLFSSLWFSFYKTSGLCLKPGDIAVLATPSQATLGPLFLCALALALGSSTLKGPM